MNATVNNSLPAWRTYSNELTAWFTIMLIFCILGGFFNTCLFLIIITSQKLRSGSGYLIAHLLLTNAVLCSVHMLILSVSTYFYAPVNPLSDTFCQHTLLWYYASLDSVNYTSLLIGINRLIAIIFPHHYPHLTTKPVTFSMVLFPWMIGFTLALLVYFRQGAVFQSTPPWGTCGVAPAPETVTYTVITHLAATVPITALGGVYLLIFLHVGVEIVRRQRQVVAAEAVKEVRKRVVFRRRWRSVRMLFVSYVWYTCCLMPAPIAAGVFAGAYTSQPVLALFLRALLLFGYATIPVVCLSINADYKNRCRMVLSRIHSYCTGDIGHATADGVQRRFTLTQSQLKEVD
ncbi:uncharacterized protein LOC129601408 [Paramacrobiotus metropolitanus]|uniref:uncharacterized protein LOC129601408 n=1 Tax=Paramacrobiotus metropolitanus TaxID=2943436 RepID=UPI0024457A5D|nr:uncharacterized protein LOC129601408 [Paramacrobiotus metropolitanus]